MTFRCITLLIALLLPIAAQDAAPKTKGDIQVRFLAEVAPQELGEVILTGETTRSEPFTLPTNRLSEPVLASNRTLILKTAAKNIPVCTIQLPEAGKSFAVVLATAKTAGFTSMVVRTDDGGFKAGDVVFINRSPKTVLGKLGDTSLVLKPGEIKKDRPTGAKDNTYYDIIFATRDEAGDKIISSTRWPVDNLLRSYVFFFTNAQGKTTYRGVDEYLDLPAAKKN